MKVAIGLFVCVGLLLGPAVVFSAGPPNGLDVNILNTPDVNVVGTPAVYQFAGYSSATTKGSGVGIGGMHALCQEYGADARMCTTKELLLSPNVPYGCDSGCPVAWVQPTIVTTSGSMHYDYSGTPFSVNWGTCYQWTNETSATKGMMLKPDSGSLLVLECDNELSFLWTVNNC